MTEKEQLAAVFFDFDGVILNSTATKTQGFISLFREYGDEVIAQVVALHRAHGGVSRVEKIKYAHDAIIGRPLSRDALALRAQEYSDLVLEKVIHAPWIKGAESFLARFYESVPFFVISGTSGPELTHIIDKRGMALYFREVLGSPEKKGAHIRMLLEKYRLDPGRCLFVGDALTDYNAAKETGLHFIGIQGEADFPEHIQVLPDCTGLAPAIEARFQLGPAFG